ncbi:undecaprenyl-diphosphate phosphatase [Candidatus Mycalebacterium sp.]
MENRHTAILGVVQGITEVLPVSSTAHLMIFSWLLSWRDGGLDLAVWLHFGTLISILFCFRKEWAAIAGALLRSARSGSFESADAKMGVGLAITILPAAAVGFVFEAAVAGALRHPAVVAGALLVGSAVLFAADRKKGKTKRLASLSIKDCVFFGVAQSFALVPGVSRSGVSIAGGMFLGYTREDAAKFAFMMGVPVIGAAIARTVWKNGFVIPNESEFLAGTIAAALTGVVSIRFLLRFVRNRSYAPFVIYRVALAALILVFFQTRFFPL